MAQPITRKSPTPKRAERSPYSEQVPRERAAARAAVRRDEGPLTARVRAAAAEPVERWTTPEDVPEIEAASPSVFTRALLQAALHEGPATSRRVAPAQHGRRGDGRRVTPEDIPEFEAASPSVFTRALLQAARPERPATLRSPTPPSSRRPLPGRHPRRAPPIGAAAPRGREGGEGRRPSRSATIGERITRIFRLEPDRIFTASEVQVALSHDGLEPVGPDSVRVNLMRLTKEGFLERPHYGRYRWVVEKKTKR